MSPLNIFKCLKPNVETAANRVLTLQDGKIVEVQFKPQPVQSASQNPNLPSHNKPQLGSPTSQNIVPEKEDILFED